MRTDVKPLLCWKKAQGRGVLTGSLPTGAGAGRAAESNQAEASLSGLMGTEKAEPPEGARAAVRAMQG